MVEERNAQHLLCMLRAKRVRTAVGRCRRRGWNARETAPHLLPHHVLIQCLENNPRAAQAKHSAATQRSVGRAEGRAEPELAAHVKCVGFALPTAHRAHMSLFNCEKRCSKCGSPHLGSQQ